MITEITGMVLPALIMIVLGAVCRRSGLVSGAGLEGIKSVIGNICLPAVLFSAFFKAEYNLQMLAVCVCVYLGYGVALFLGFALRKRLGDSLRYLPALVTSAEGGMLGYSLYGLLMGSGRLSYFAVVDLGQTLFAYTAFLAALRFIDGKPLSAGGSVKMMFTNRPFLGMFLGIVLGASGAAGYIRGSAFGDIAEGALTFISSPTGALILLVVGYEMAVSRRLIRPVLLTVFARLAVLGCVYLLVSFVLSQIMTVSADLRFALLLLYALPAPFIIPLFMENTDSSEYVSASLSAQTIAALALSTVLAATSRIQA